MATLKDYRDERLRKLAELRQLGVDPYPAKSNRTHEIAAVLAQFDELEGQTVKVVGRIVSIRKFGKLAFVVIRDTSSQTIQLFIRKGETKVMEFQAVQEGDFTFYCEMCGGPDSTASGHIIIAK